MDSKDKDIINKALEFEKAKNPNYKYFRTCYSF